MKIEFAGPSLKDSDNAWAATSRLLNLYREPIGDRMIVKPVLGTVLFGDLSGVFCRAMATVDGLLYVVHGERLYSVASNGLATELGIIPDDPQTTISGNNGKVTVCAGGNYYLWDGTTLTEPAAGAFSEFGSVTFFAQKTVLTERGGRRVQWSLPADPDTLDGLDFATAERGDADILRAVPVGGGLWIMKTNSYEVWQSKTDGSLDIVPGSTVDLGLKAFSLMTVIPNGLFFIGNDNVAYLGSNGGRQRVSTAGVETSIAAENPTGCAYFEDEGHKFCALLFDGRPAWVYDIATGEWHERTEGNDLGPWSVQAVTSAYGGFIAGTTTGKLVRFARVGRDLGATMIKRAVGRTFGGDMQRFRVSELALPVRVGTVDNPPAGEAVFELVPVTILDGTPVTMLDDDGEPVVIVDEVEVARAPVEEAIELRVSGNNGFTWSDPMPRGLGLLGQFDRRVVWTRLGQFQQMTAEISYGGSADITFDATIEARVA